MLMRHLAAENLGKKYKRRRQGQKRDVQREGRVVANRSYQACVWIEERIFQ